MQGADQGIMIVESRFSVSKKHVQRHAVILAHPDAQSFNCAVAQTYCETVRELGHEAILRDLYRLNFNPVLKANERPQTATYVLSDDVAAEVAAIGEADLFVLVYPVWFSSPPAMLKGYIERVFGSDFSHLAIRERTEHRFLTGKHLLSITTSGSSIQWLDEQGAWLSMKNLFGQYLAKAFSMASTEHLHLANIVEQMDERHVKEELYHVKEMAREMCARLSTADAGIPLARAAC
jgi:NAD(P)H dehydrogenase (quinone)